MVRVSVTAAVAALATVVAAQVDTPSALPAVSAPGGMQCGGCYVVADVAGVVFGSVATQTVSRIVVTGTNNGSSPMTVTTTVPLNAGTSVIQGQGQATITNAAGEGNAPGVVTAFNPSGGTITLSNAVLTSPTQYEVFTAFVVVQNVSTNGACSMSTGTKSNLGSAIQYPVPSNVGSGFLSSAEANFIQRIGFPSCSNGGSNVASTIHVPVAQTTESTTTNALPSAAASGTYIMPNITSAPSIVPANGGSVQAVNPMTAFGSAAALAIAIGVLAVAL